MFNKTIVSIVSSLVMFACNVKDDTPPPVDDVVSSVTDVAAEQPKSSPVTPTVPVVTPIPAAGDAVPLTASGVSAGMTAPTTQTPPVAIIPVQSQPVPAPQGSSVVAPSVTAPVK